MCVCVHVCVRACVHVRACARVCVHAGVCVRVRMCVCACCMHWILKRRTFKECVSILSTHYYHYGGRRTMREGPRVQRETLYSWASRTMGLFGNQKMVLLSWKNMMKVWSYSDVRIWWKCEATLMKEYDESVKLLWWNMMKVWSYSDVRIWWKCEATLMKYDESVKLLWCKNMMKVWSYSDEIWWKCEATLM